MHSHGAENDYSQGRSNKMIFENVDTMKEKFNLRCPMVDPEVQLIYYQMARRAGKGGGPCSKSKSEYAGGKFGPPMRPKLFLIFRLAFDHSSGSPNSI